MHEKDEEVHKRNMNEESDKTRVHQMKVKEKLKTYNTLTTLKQNNSQIRLTYANCPTKQKTRQSQHSLKI